MNMQHIPVLRLTILAALMLCYRNPVAKELWFPPELVSGSGATADLSQFNKGEQLPGSYRVSVWLNRTHLYDRDVKFIVADSQNKHTSVKDSTGLMACLTNNDLIDAGVRPEAFESQERKLNDRQCLSLGSIIPQATTYFDFQKMRLDIGIPQRWMQKQPRNWISPTRWDNGIPAALLNYDYSGTESRGRYGNNRSHYLRLNSGMNIGAWRLRDERSMSEYRGASHHRREWRHGRTWLERGVTALHSTLAIGDTLTDGQIFDSTSIRGATLMTDDSMYPDSEQGYAPVIRGTALSNARVSIRQNGYVMYEINVAPGEFAINDINPMYSSGDLEVTVTEADGGIRTFTVPYATVPGLLREGRVKYALSIGKLQGFSHHDNYQHPDVLQGTLTWGAPRGTTAYGGLQFSKNYQSAAMGAGVNMGSWGAFSVDVTHADSTLADGSNHHGQSFRFLYSRGFEATGTAFQLAGYRYSTQGFYTLEESSRVIMQGWRGEQQRDAAGRLIPRPASDWYDLKDNRRERMEVNVTQRVGDSSSLYLTGSRQTWWHGRGASTSLQAGFSSYLGPVSYNLSYNESHIPSPGRTDRSLFLSLSVPLDSLFPWGGKSTYASFSTGRNGYGEITQQLGLSGTALELHNLNWNVSQSHTSKGGDSGSVNLAYQGTYGNVSAGYSQGSGYHQTSYDVAGGLVLHGGGLTASQPLGNTSVLVSVPGTTGVPLEGDSGIRTDPRGYAVRPWATAFRENRVALDVAHMDARTEVAEPVVRVIPTKGAIVRADFVAKSGLRVLMMLMKNGKPLPFGTLVSTGNSGGIVGDNGQVWLTGLARNGTLTAKWGNDTAQTCEADWHIAESVPVVPLVRTTITCR